MTLIADMPAGFADPVLAAQSTFRAVMDAMARPGSVQHIAADSGVPSPLMPAAAAVALTLFDQDISVWFDATLGAAEIAGWIRFHTSAPVTSDMSACQFAVVGAAAALPDFAAFAQGTADYPDRSTTVILQVASLSEGAIHELRGPGIDGTATLRTDFGIPDMPQRLAANAARFPCGVDLVLVSGDRLVALPRTTRLVAKEG